MVRHAVTFVGLLVSTTASAQQGFVRPASVYSTQCEAIVALFQGTVEDVTLAAYLTGVLDGILVAQAEPEGIAQRFVDMCDANPGLDIWTTVQFAQNRDLAIGPLGE